MNLHQLPEKQREQKPLEMPIGCDLDERSKQRFVSSRTMYQVRLKILKRLSSRIKKEISLDSSNESFSPGVS
jgi:hypothetical protein